MLAQPKLTNHGARSRVWLVAVVFFAEMAHLAWEHANGGIVSHHVLHRADLPAIWNGWGLLVLPALAWFLGGRAVRRVADRPDRRTAAIEVLAGLAIALALGALLSIAFVQGLESLAATLFFGILVLAVLLPAYRAECILGFVLGMAFTFGAVLPAMIGGVLAAVSAIAHRGLYPVVARAWRWSRRARVAR